MKKLISCILVVLLMVCGVVSASAVVSPLPTVQGNYIVIDSVAVPEEGGTITPSVIDPEKYDKESDETVTIVATPNDGYKFSNWEIVTGEFDIVEGDMTTSTIVILPKGDGNIRLNAVFVKADEDVVPPTTKPVYPPTDDDKSPTTGQPVFVYSAVVVAILAAGFAAVVLKKKAY